jgi:hypothetical protein
MTLAFLDDLHAGLEHLDNALAYFRSEPYPAGRYRLGNNPGVVCLTTSAFILWILGHPDRGRQRADEAIAVATGLEHPLTLAYGLFHAGYLHLWRREADLVRDRAERLLHLDGQAGRVEEGLAMVDEALEIAGRGSGTTMLPEFQLLKGDLLLTPGQGNGADPEPWFQQAFDIAQRLDARMSQLRAAVRLCRLRSDRDAGTAAALLRAVYDTFTEGFTTADLIEARAPLETLQ